MSQATSDDEIEVVCRTLPETVNLLFGFVLKHSMQITNSLLLYFYILFFLHCLLIGKTY